MSRDFIEIRLSKQPPIKCYQLECPLVADLTTSIDRSNLRIAVRVNGRRAVVYGTLSTPDELPQFEGKVCQLESVWDAAVSVLKLLTDRQRTTQDQQIRRWATALIQSMPSVEFDKSQLDTSN